MTPQGLAGEIEIAKAVGEHPLAVFAALLIVLLFLVGVGWLALHRGYIRQRRLPSGAAARSLLATLVLGFAAILAAGALFASLPGWIVVDGWVGLMDMALTDGLRRTVSTPMLRFFATVSFLANTPTLWVLGALVGAMLLWQRQELFALAWIAALGGNGVLTRMLKALFARVRPIAEHDLFMTTGWSFPSGHSSGAVVAYGMLAYLWIRLRPDAPHLPVVLIACAVAFTIGCSRIFLQVHYASDVLAGFALGAAWLAVCVMAAETVRFRERRAKQLA